MAGVVLGYMADTKTIIEQAYYAFNKRKIDVALALMTQDVSWPKASEGAKVVGKEEIRAYWTRQWGEFDPYVEPLAMTEEHGGKTRVMLPHGFIDLAEGTDVPLDCFQHKLPYLRLPLLYPTRYCLAV
jgi:hypothetical protein